MRGIVEWSVALAVALAVMALYVTMWLGSIYVVVKIAKWAWFA